MCFRLFAIDVALSMVTDVVDVFAAQPSVRKERIGVQVRADRDGPPITTSQLTYQFKSEKCGYDWKKMSAR
jgi:hypothetical protein